MKALLVVLGVGAARAVCCAVPLALPVLAGLGLAGFGIAGAAMPDIAWIIGLIAVSVLLAGSLYLWRKRQAAPACIVDAGCGCSTAR